MSVKAPKKPPQKQIDLFHLAENITSNIGVGVYIVQRGKFVYISPLYSKITGYSDPELLGKNSLERVHPEDRAMVREKAIKSLKGKSPESYEYRYIRKNGEIMWILEMIASIPYNGCRAALGSFIDITERKKMEDALRQSEERYRTVLEEIEEGYYEINLQGNFTFVSDAICATLGYSREELIGMNYKTYVPEEEIKNTYRIWRKAYQTGETIKWYPLINIRKDGRRIAVEDSMVPLRDKEGKIIGFKGVTRDVTERRRMEDAIRLSEEKYRTILENMEEGYFELDLEGNYTFVNEANCRFLGYTKEELVGMNSRQHMDEETAKKLSQLYYELYRTGKPIKSLEVESFRKDKTKVVYETSASLIRDSEGKPIGFRGVSRDITARKQAEAALRKSEEKYRTILENIEDGYYEVDLAGNFTFFNDSMCQILGYTKEELMGMNNRQFTDKENAKKLFKTFNEVYRTGEPAKEFGWQIIRKDGTKRYIEVSVSLQKYSSGKPIGFRGISRDITERRQMEEMLRLSEEKYRTILEDMEEGYFELDLNGTFTFVNDAECKNIGYSRAELIGMNYRQYQKEETAKKLRQIFIELYRTGKPVRLLDVEIIKKDKNKVFNETSVSLIRDKNGKPIGFRGVSRDVTKRRQMEEMIRQSEEKYRTIIDEMDEWYFEFDLTGNIVFINDAVTRSVGYSTQKLIGLNYRTFVQEGKNAEVYKIFRQVYETGEPIKNFPYELNRPDGNKSFFDVSVFPKIDQDGKVFGFRGVAHDITERKRTEQQLNYIATHDLLTGLPNRMLLMDRLKMAMAQAKRSDEKLAVMMLDLDNFKNVNDTLGHMLGDELLKEISLRLTGRLRQNDTISRLGGDEFIILLPVLERTQDAVEVAEIIIESFEQPFICDGHTISTSISIGISIYPDDCQDMDSLLKNADMAMYYVKAHGRNGCQLFADINFNHSDQRIQ
ncbi:MAG: hypothetical protein A2W27_08600 [Deltaproteobacteria bacterium RBG_16_44_11]|nr:MAG: hypothetical protein A2W27_08600 [Deltaproteobacteria bacterium RBG_16_44_11]